MAGNSGISGEFLAEMVVDEFVVDGGRGRGRGRRRTLLGRKRRGDEDLKVGAKILTAGTGYAYILLYPAEAAMSRDCSGSGLLWSGMTCVPPGNLVGQIRTSGFGANRFRTIVADS